MHEDLGPDQLVLRASKKSSTYLLPSTSPITNTANRRAWPCGSALATACLASGSTPLMELAVESATARVVVGSITMWHSERTCTKGENWLRAKVPWQQQSPRRSPGHQQDYRARQRLFGPAPVRYIGPRVRTLKLGGAGP